jgi:hypothetical protein
MSVLLLVYLLQAPLHFSNVMLVDPLSKKPVRTYFMYEDQPPYKRVRLYSRLIAGRLPVLRWEHLIPAGRQAACAEVVQLNPCRQPACTEVGQLIDCS